MTRQVRSSGSVLMFASAWRPGPGQAGNRPRARLRSTCWHVLCRSLVALTVMLFAGRALAQNEGQADLDKATQLKISATTINDLTEVIRLCDAALKKGLDQNNSPFAKDLLSSTLVQRGTVYANKAFRSLLTEGNWQQDRKEALADLEKGLAQNPKQPQASYLIARLNLLPEGDAKRAATALDAAIAQSEDEPTLQAEALILRSGNQKDPNRRLADLDEAVRVAPGDASVFRSRGATRADMNKLEPAIDDFNKAIELDPKQVSSYQLKVMVLVKQKKLADALAVLDKARSVAPDNVDLPVTKARIYTLDANYKSALDELNRAAAVEPANLGVLLLRAAVYQEMGNKAKALEDIDKILKLKPRLPAAMRDRAILLSDLGKFDDAVSQLEQLQKANPKDPLTLLQLGMLYTAQKSYDKSVAAYSALLADHPEEWMAYRGRGDALLNLGRRIEAVADYDKALARQPKDVGVLNNLAWVLATAPEDKLRDGKRAIVLAVEACKLTDYKQDYILSTLAAAHAEAGEFQNALTWSNKAVELATKEHLEALKKEVESYKAHKPWREALPEPRDKKPAEQKAAK